MSHSSLFSFEESTVCDPKVLRKHMIVPQDQLTKLNSIPGWTKVESFYNTLRLDKEFSIENSQSKSSIDATQNKERIERNTDIFNEQLENRKKIIKAYKDCGKKLTRSSSLFTINENCENLLNRKTLVRTLSLQSLCHSFDSSDIIHFEKFRCENSSNFNHFRNKNILSNITLTDQCVTSLSDKEIYFEKEVSTADMQAVSELPVSILALVENVNIHFEKTEDNIETLLAENAAPGSSNVFDIHITHVAQSMNADKADLLPEITKENNSELAAENVALCSNDIHDQPLKTVIDIESNVEEFMIHSLDKFTESHVFATIESNKSNASNVNEILANVVSTSACPLEGNEPSVATSNEFISVLNSVDKIASEDVAMTSVDKSNDSATTSVVRSDDSATTSVVRSNDSATTSVVKSNDSAITSIDRSNDSKSREICLGKSAMSDDPVKELPIFKKGTVSETEDLIRSAKYDKADDMKSDEKNCNGDKTYNPVNSTDNVASFSKKRKLESKNKRSKRLKSEDKQGNVKIRSIKKVGEVCYSVEEVKTMLDIMKQLL